MGYNAMRTLDLDKLMSQHIPAPNVIDLIEPELNQKHSEYFYFWYGFNTGLSQVRKVLNEQPIVEAVPIDFVAGKMANALGCPCNVSPLDEQMSAYCGTDCHMHDIDCWQRVIRMWSGLPLEEQNGGNDGTEEQIK